MIHAIKALSRTQKRHILLFTVCLLFLGALFLYLMKPNVIGLLYDDGMYLMSGQSLAKGEGYHLSGIIGQPTFYKYPPLYPTVLALGLMFFHAVQNVLPAVPGLKGITVIFSLGALCVLHAIGRRQLGLSFLQTMGLLLILGTNFRYIEISTELMSEALYFLLSLTALYLAESFLKAEKQTGFKPLIGILGFSLLAFYTRTMGITLIGAIALTLFLKKQGRAAWIYSVTSLLGLIPWFAYSLQQKPIVQKIGLFTVRSFQESYFQSFKFDLQESGTVFNLYAAGFKALLENFSLQFFPCLERLMLPKDTPFSAAAILSSSFLLALFLGFYAYQKMKAGHWRVSAVYTGLYLAILPFWSYYSVYPRFILMVLPFLWIACFHVLQTICRPQGNQNRAILALLVLTIASNVIHLYPALARSNPNQLLLNYHRDLWRDYADASAYLAEKTPNNAVIATEYGEEAYIYALNGQRRTMDRLLFMPNTLLEAQCPAKDTIQIRTGCLQNVMLQRAEAFRLLWKQHGVRYVVSNRFTVKKNTYNTGMLMGRPHPVLPFVEALHPGTLLPVYRSPDDWIVVYRIEQ